MAPGEHQPRYRASYRWRRYGPLGRREQEWFVLDTTTGEVAKAHPLWGRAEAVFAAKQMNKEEEGNA